jgi:hypothetical protein
MPPGITTIERALESNTSLVFDLSLNHLDDTVPEIHPIEPAGDPASLSKYLLATVDLQDVQLREAPTQDQSDTDPLSFRDLMWLCMVLNERVGSTQLLFEGNHNKNLKLIQVVDAVFGVHENESADRARRITQRQTELAEAGKSLIFKPSSVNKMPRHVKNSNMLPRRWTRSWKRSVQRFRVSMRTRLPLLISPQVCALDTSGRHVKQVKLDSGFEIERLWSVDMPACARSTQMTSEN